MSTPEWREEAGLNPRTRQGGKVANDDRIDWSEAWTLFPGDVAYVWHAGIHAAEVALGLQAYGFQVRSQIIWVKQHFAISRGPYHWRHEPCWSAVRKGQTGHWHGDRTQTTIWEVANLNPFGGEARRRMKLPATAPRSRSKSCAGRFSTTRVQGRVVTTRSWEVAAP
jgi:hypothetical protein